MRMEDAADLQETERLNLAAANMILIVVIHSDKKDKKYKMRREHFRLREAAQTVRHCPPSHEPVETVASQSQKWKIAYPTGTCILVS